MTRGGQYIAALSASIREFARNPTSRDASELTPLTTALLTILKQPAPFSPDESQILTAIVLNYYRIIQKSKAPDIIKTCLIALLRFDRFGRILAVRFIHSKALSLRQLTDIITTFPARDRLALAHEMLTDYPGNLDKNDIRWLEAIMQPLAAADPMKLLPFLVSLSKQGETLAFPAKTVITGEFFGKWLTTTLKTGAKGVPLDQLCHTLLALNDPQYATLLSQAIMTGNIAPTPMALHAVSNLAEAGDKAVIDMFHTVLNSSNKDLAGACLDGLIHQQASTIGKLLATIRRQTPAMRKTANARVPFLSGKAYADYLAALPEKQRETAEKDAFSALLSIAPDFVEALTKTKITPAPVSTNPLKEKDSSRTGQAESASARPGFFARFFGPRKNTLEKVILQFQNIRDMDVMCSNMKNETVEGRELTSSDLSKSTFTNVQFIRSKLSSCTIRKTTFTGGKHVGTTYTKTNFSESDFTDVVFSQCVFNDCDFTHSALSNCTFADCRFQGCTMDGVDFLKGKIRRTSMSASVFSGAVFSEIDATSSRFESTDFSSTKFIDSTFKGVEFIDSVILDATFTGTHLYAVNMPGSTVHGCRISHCDLPHSLFLSNRVHQFPNQACQAATAPLPDSNPVPRKTAKKVLRAWIREITFLRREERMQAYNRARLSRAIHSLKRDKQVFLRILPYLLTTDAFEQKFNLQGIPSCEIWGYTPSLTAMELAAPFFPDHAPATTTPDICILAVYTMGSLGTVAQTAQSDIDCWVCYEGDIAPKDEAGLKRKLDALSLWAEREFGVEAHFFPMRMEDIRANKFSSGDEESSGSAQALLLKEEFYRTALRIAGKDLAWWLTPAGINKTTYDKYIATARCYPLTGQPRMEDFGHLAPIPPDEYFGGSLWQMVKAVHSPFKSVLKLGLLATYADPKTSQLPLCERIKHTLFMRQKDVRKTDPYATLFFTLHAYYVGRDDEKTAQLLTESFLFKTNLCDMPFFMNLPARKDDASLIRAMFGKACIDPQKYYNCNDLHTFSNVLKMGGAVRRYMITTYQHIQDALKKRGSNQTFINAKDLTRMGRRIGANFSQKPYKIMRVPFMDTKGEGFHILHLSGEKAPGKKPSWIARGGSRAEAKKSANSLQFLHRSGDPVVMLTWLLANRLYTPQSLLQADLTIAPLSIADLQKLLPAMYEFFPFEDTFERDINEGLEAERVTRIFLIFNLTETNLQNIEQVATIYTTNWGEMYCRTFINPGKKFENQPIAYLANHLDHAVVDSPQIHLFIPKGAQCKRIAIN